jgi:23S rRNA (uracil1939-C5)-methyltransferase
VDPDRPGSALCPHFGTCGGCATQDVPYDRQLAAKDGSVRLTLAPFSPGRFSPIRPSPDVFHYRNKMEFAFGADGAVPPALGLRRKGSYKDLVDLSECRLLSAEAPALLAAVRGWAARQGLPAYRSASRRGFLRYLVVREGKNTGQRMVHLVTAEGELDGGPLLRALDDAGVRADSVVWSVNAGLSDVARGEFRRSFRGPGYIEDSLLGRVFRVSPGAFFQTNTRGAEILYRIVADSLGDGVDTLLDLYCGAGTIGLCLADRARRVIGIELEPAAAEDARANAIRLGAAHAEFWTSDAGAAARGPELVGLWSRPGTVAVVDPPRAGLAPALRELLRARPLERVVYVSCHAEALARDLAVLTEAYRLDAVHPVDLFPHTPHVETVACLTRRTGGSGPT